MISFASGWLKKLRLFYSVLIFIFGINGLKIDLYTIPEITDLSDYFGMLNIVANIFAADWTNYKCKGSLMLNSRICGILFNPLQNGLSMY